MRLPHVHGTPSVDDLLYVQLGDVTEQVVEELSCHGVLTSDRDRVFLALGSADRIDDAGRYGEHSHNFLRRGELVAVEYAAPVSNQLRTGRSSIQTAVRNSFIQRGEA